MWNTFERQREALEKQYQHPDFDSASGSDPVSLQSEMESYYTQNANRPFILVRAELMDFFFQHCRLSIDPEDWFADHLEGRNLLLSLQKRKLQEARDALPPEARDTVVNYIKTGTFVPGLDLSHTSPDWADILLLGPSGLRDSFWVDFPISAESGCWHIIRLPVPNMLLSEHPTYCETILRQNFLILVSLLM